MTFVCPAFGAKFLTSAAHLELTCNGSAILQAGLALELPMAASAELVHLVTLADGNNFLLRKSFCLTLAGSNL